MPIPFELPKTWWDHDRNSSSLCDERLANAVCEAVQEIERNQRSIHDGHQRHARIYAGYLPSGLSPGSSTNHQRQPFEATRGVVRSVCDTATSLIVRSRPKATFVTDGADWHVQQQAEDLDQFMVGAYAAGDVYPVATRVFHDSTVFGTGAWKYVTRGKGENFKVVVERVLIDDLIVDENECRVDLEPVNTYHRMQVRVDALVKKYASGDSAMDRELRRKLMSSYNNGGSWAGRTLPKEYTYLVEAIHVDIENPSNSRRVLCVPGAVLKDERWPYPWHPYTVLRWALPPTGFYGDGIAYRQFGRQQRITYLYRWIQRCQELFATPRAWVPPQGGPPTMHMSNELGQVVTAHRSSEVQFQIQQSVPPDIFNWLNGLEQGTFEDEGISLATAANQLPQGIESAPAQREYSYKEGQRFAPVSQRWEQALGIETATKMTAMYRRFAETHKEQPRVRWADRKMLFSIDWPDLEENQYLIRADISSIESLSPAARIQSAIELAQTGWVSPLEGRRLVGHPDIKESDDLATAALTEAKWILRKLYRGEAVEVDEFSDFTIIHQTVLNGYRLAKTRNAPESILAGIGHFLDNLDNKMKEAADAQAAQQMAMAGGPMGPGGGAPQPAMAPGAAEGMPLPMSNG